MRYSDKIGREIRSVREAKGYSQEYLAEMLGICQSTYANLEAGKTNLSVDRLISIMEILEVDARLLLQFTNSTNQSMVLADHKSSTQHSDVDPAIFNVYDQLIEEMRGEIEFLREMLRGQKQ